MAIFYLSFSDLESNWLGCIHISAETVDDAIEKAVELDLIPEGEGQIHPVELTPEILAVPEAEYIPKVLDQFLTPIAMQKLTNNNLVNAMDGSHYEP